MPYRSLESFSIEEECIRKWAEDLSPRTARNYVYYFLRYLRWVKRGGSWSSAEEMLSNYRELGSTEKFKHLDVLESYIKSRDTGVSDRRHTWFAVRSFYAYHRLPLPRPPRNEVSRLFRPSQSDKRRAIELSPLMLDEVRRLVLNAPQPYKAALMAMFQSAMSLAEFDEFNLVSWKKIVENLDEPGPIRIDLFREKTSRTTVKKYYTFIGRDAKDLLKEWLLMRPKDTGCEALFVTYNKNKRQYVPVNGRLVSDTIRKVAKRIGLIKPNEHRRYHVHAHEFRDLFKSLCTITGVHPVASEFFLGHSIDKLGYDKSPKYDPELFRKEYIKVEAKLNIISNPAGTGVEDKMEEMRKEIALNAIRNVAEALGIDPIKVKIEKRKNLGKEPSPEEEIRAIQNEIKKLRSGNNDPKKVISEKDLPEHLSNGWDVQTVLPSGKIIIRKEQ